MIFAADVKKAELSPRPFQLANFVCLTLCGFANRAELRVFCNFETAVVKLHNPVLTQQASEGTQPVFTREVISGDLYHFHDLRTREVFIAFNERDIRPSCL